MTDLNYMLRAFNFKAILSRWIAKKDEGVLQKRSDFCTLWQFIQCMNEHIALRSNVCIIAIYEAILKNFEILFF